MFEAFVWWKKEKLGGSEEVLNEDEHSSLNLGRSE